MVVDMTVFGSYARYYDLIYKDKDYPVEVEFIESLIHQYGAGDVTTILDLGCGTGNHALLLAEKGYSVTGVDRSEDMLAIARKKATIEKITVEFVKADIRDFKLNKKFDTIIAMFAVMSYQTKNEDIEQALKTAYRHLTPGGLFIFDVWFGPAVLTERPTTRVKILENESGGRVIRIAQPELNLISQTVQVDYTTMLINGDHILEEVKESHLMRYFFHQELQYYLEKNGYVLLKICPFMELDRTVDKTCWNISVICKKGI